MSYGCGFSIGTWPHIGWSEGRRNWQWACSLQMYSLVLTGLELHSRQTLLSLSHHPPLSAGTHRLPYWIVKPSAILAEPAVTSNSPWLLAKLGGTRILHALCFLLSNKLFSETAGQGLWVSRFPNSKSQEWKRKRGGNPSEWRAILFGALGSPWQEV